MNYWEVEEKTLWGGVWAGYSPLWWVLGEMVRQCVCLACFGCQWPLHTRVKQQLSRTSTKILFPAWQPGQLGAQGAGTGDVNLPARAVAGCHKCHQAPRKEHDSTKNGVCCAKFWQHISDPPVTFPGRSGARRWQLLDLSIFFLPGLKFLGACFIPRYVWAFFK